MSLAETDIDEITNLLFSKHGVDFRNYNKSSFTRRLAHFMTLKNIPSKELLKTYLHDLKEISFFVEEITVNTTALFRDPSFWLVLRNKILPELNHHKHIRIWHAGCSSGEEVISMQILLRELAMEEKTAVFASDIDTSVLRKAVKASYSLRHLALSEDNYIFAGGKHSLDLYLDGKDQQSFSFQKKLVNAVTFEKFDLVKDTNYSKFDLILCRNVMLYFDSKLQERVLQEFCTGLYSKGFIAIGQKEAILNHSILENLTLFDAAEKIYRSKN